jgi:hypothetical protein
VYVYNEYEEVTHNTYLSRDNSVTRSFYMNLSYAIANFYTNRSEDIFLFRNTYFIMSTAAHAVNRAYAKTNYKIHNDIHKQHEFQQQKILDDELLPADEKCEAMTKLTTSYDKVKIIYNEGTRRFCENCNQECLATFYCEYCVRNYLKNNFSNWTSGNVYIDNLMHECQINAYTPNDIVEWIQYNNLNNIKYLTKGGCSEIYTASWIDGRIVKWDPKEKQLKRFGSHDVILKKLENVGNANQIWIEEVCSYFKNIQYAVLYV